MTTIKDPKELTEKIEQHVLILDDDISLHKALNRMLIRKNVPWEFSFANHVDEALETIRNKKIDMIISDIKMPGKDGFHMLKSLRESPHWSDMPVMMITAFDHSRLKTKAIELGAVDLLTKPVKPDEMLARINSVLKEKQQKDELKNKLITSQEESNNYSKQIWFSKIEIILRLAMASQFRNIEDSDHVVRVGYYSKILSEQLNNEKKFGDELFVASPLHDIGKIAIPDSVLLKTDQFTDKDKAIMNCHCKLGYDLLQPQISSPKTKTMDLNKMISAIFEVHYTPKNHLLDLAAEIALSHHEWFNGKGYPYGLKGKEIPLSARIVSIADVYDALRNQRPYKPAYSHKEAIGIMRENISTQFDPEIFSGFEKCADEFNRISQIKTF